MSRVLRPVACVIAATAVATGVATAVLNVIGEDARHRPRARPVRCGAVRDLRCRAGVRRAVRGLRQPGNRVAWILLLGALSVSVVMPPQRRGLALEHDRASGGLGPRGRSVARAVPVAARAGFVFPDGRLPSSRWRPVAAARVRRLRRAVFAAALRPESDRATGASRARCRYAAATWRPSSGSAGRAAGVAVRRSGRAAGPATARRRAAAPAGPVAGLRRAAGAALAGRRLAARAVIGSIEDVDSSADDAAGLAGGRRGGRGDAPRAVRDRPARQPHAGLRRADGAAGRDLRARRAAHRAGRRRLGADGVAGDDRRRAGLPAVARPHPAPRRPPLRRAHGSTRCGCCATSSRRCATAAPSPRTSAR